MDNDNQRHARTTAHDLTAILSYPYLIDYFVRKKIAVRRVIRSAMRFVTERVLYHNENLRLKNFFHVAGFAGCCRVRLKVGLGFTVGIDNCNHYFVPEGQ